MSTSPWRLCVLAVLVSGRLGVVHSRRVQTPGGRNGAIACPTFSRGLKAHDRAVIERCRVLLQNPIAARLHRFAHPPGIVVGKAAILLRPGFVLVPILNHDLRFRSDYAVQVCQIGADEIEVEVYKDAERKDEIDRGGGDARKIRPVVQNLDDVALGKIPAQFGEQFGVVVDDVKPAKAQQVARPAAAAGPDFQTCLCRIDIRRQPVVADGAQPGFRRTLRIAPLQAVEPVD